MLHFSKVIFQKNNIKMRKFKIFLIFLSFIVITTIIYLNYSFTTYSQPQIEFTTTKNLTHPIKPYTNLTCFKQNQKVQPIDQNHFKVLVWNIHKAGDPGWLQNLKKYAIHRDFLLLQESTQKVLHNPVLDKQFPHRLYASSFRYQNKSSGVSIFSRFNPESYCAGMVPEPWIKIPKVGVAEFFPIKNHLPLLVINIHAINFELKPTNYRKQVKQLMEVLHQYKGPVILAGDFNAWNTYRHHFLQKITTQYGLQEVKFYPDYRLRFWGNPLDYVYIRGLKVEKATTEQTQSSDHNPLLLELSLPKTNP